MIYKYTSCSRHAFENVKERQIFCRHYSGFNDPFEFWAIIEEGIPTRETDSVRFERALKAWGFETDYCQEVQDYFDEVRDYQTKFSDVFEGLRISCFSRELNNLLMWSHYADGLRGFCLEFDEKRLVSGREDSFVMEVRYSEDPPVEDAFEYAIANDQLWYCDVAYSESRNRMYQDDIPRLEKIVHRILQDAFATKPIDWRYEKEIRLILQMASDGPVLHHYPTDALKRIIVGERISDRHLRDLKKAITDAGLTAPLSTARRRLDAYAIDVVSGIATACSLETETEISKTQNTFC